MSCTLFRSPADVYTSWQCHSLIKRMIRHLSSRATKVIQSRMLALSRCVPKVSSLLIVVEWN